MRAPGTVQYPEPCYVIYFQSDKRRYPDLKECRYCPDGDLVIILMIISRRDHITEDAAAVRAERHTASVNSIV